MTQSKKRYRMYKSGKVWVFAGMTLVALNLNMVNGRADERTDSENQIEQVTTPGLASGTEQQMATDEQLAALPLSDSSDVNTVESQVDKINDSVDGEREDANSIVEQPSDEPGSDEADAPNEQQADSQSSASQSLAAADTDDSEQSQTDNEFNQAVESPQDIEGHSKESSEPVLPKGQLGSDVTEVVRNPERPERLNEHRYEDNDAMTGTWKPDLKTDGIKWHFDANTGVLVLEGGEIYQTQDGNPWQSKSWLTRITKVIILNQVRIISNGGSFFEGLTNVECYEGLEKIDVSTATELQYFFADNIGVKELDLSSWQVGNVVAMDYLFVNSLGDSQLTTINISGWDTRKVRSAEAMFGLNERLTQIVGIESLNFGNLKYAAALFYKTGLAQLDLSKWVTNKLENFGGWFWGMSNLTSVKFGPQFKTDQVTWIQLLFAGCSRLTEVDLSGFDLRNVERNYGMFWGCASLQKITLGPLTNLAPTEFVSVGLMKVKANAQYTGYWVNTIDPNQRLTSRELIKLYSGKGTPIGTFVWEKNQAIIHAHDVTLEVGDDWNWADSIDGLTDQFGKPIDVQALYAENPRAVKLLGDRVNTSQPGTYRVTFKYAGKTVTALVIVKADQTSLNVHDTEVHAGGTWHAQDGFDGGTDKDGNSIDFNDVTVTGEVDTTKPGDYQITYTYGTQSHTVTVTVKENQSSLNLHQNQVTVHTDGQGSSTWRPQTNFHKATDSDGQLLDWSVIEVVGMPDWTVPGDYQVTYQFKDKTGQLVTATMTVTVVAGEADEQTESQSELQVQDSTLNVGDKWQPSDNLVLAKDVNGDALTIADLVMTGAVDTSQAGVYEVTYQYTDASGQVLTRVVTITVIAAANNGNVDQPEIPTDGSDATQPGTADGDETGMTQSETPADGNEGQTAMPDDDQMGNGAVEVHAGDSGAPTMTNGTNESVVPLVNGMQTTATTDHRLTANQAGNKQQELQPVHSDDTATTAKLGSANLPQTGESPSRVNVMGTLLLGLTVLGGWLGFRSKKRQ